MAENALKAVLDEAAAETRSRTLSIRMRPKEYAPLERLAGKVGIPVTVLARFLIGAMLKMPQTEQFLLEKARSARKRKGGE